jgi:hypothetical protein
MGSPEVGTIFAKYFVLSSSNVGVHFRAGMQADRFISNRGATSRGNNVLEHIDTGGSVRISLWSALHLLEEF